jgi:trigger factor
VHHLNSLFRATVTDIRRIQAAELNQELFDKLFPAGEITSEEQLRERVKGDLEKMFSRDSDWLFKRTFSREIIQRTPVQLPDEFLKKWIIVSSENPVTPEAVEHDYPMYADTMKWQLIENEIIRKYEIKVGMDEAMDHVKELYRERFASYGIPVDDERLAEMAKETLGKRDEMRNVYDQLVETRIIELVKSNCSIEEKAMSYDDFVHMVQH